MRTTLVTGIDKLFRMLVALLRNEYLYSKPPKYNAHRETKAIFVSFLYFYVKSEVCSSFVSIAGLKIILISPNLVKSKTNPFTARQSIENVRLLAIILVSVVFLRTF